MKNKCNTKSYKTRNCTLELLEGIYKNLSMCKEMITDILSKVKSSRLSKEINSQLSEYSKLSKQISEMIQTEGEDTKNKNIMTKMVTKFGVKMSTVTDDTDEHLAQIVISKTRL